MSLFENIQEIRYQMARDVEFMPLLTIDDDVEEPPEGEAYPERLPILALKNTVMFPGVIIPITVGREKSLNAIMKAYKTDRMVGVLSQKNDEEEDPSVDGLYAVGTVARIMKLLQMPDGTSTAILQGRQRFSLVDLVQEDPYMEGTVRKMQYVHPEDRVEHDALIASIKDVAYQIVGLSPHIPPDAGLMVRNINNDRFLINFIASNLGLKVPVKQTILEMDDLHKKANIVFEHMDKELHMLEIKEQIEMKVRGDLEKQQRDYFLNQQLKTIQEELGQNPQDEELEELRKRALKMKWPKEAEEAFFKEFNKARRTNPQIGEYSVLLSYLELLLDLPWEEYTDDNFDLSNVKVVLDKDHHGLEKVKDRIIEHLAVLKLKGDMKAPILCLVGPPGVGKTSLGKSVATALKRKFIRMSLGGLHDESEIRGHRKTYIGAMPGRIVKSLKKAKSSNPVLFWMKLTKWEKTFEVIHLLRYWKSWIQSRTHISMIIISN